MDARQERGLVIAATSRIEQNKLGWKVPSQSGLYIRLLPPPLNYSLRPNKKGTSHRISFSGHQCPCFIHIPFPTIASLLSC